MYTSYTHVWDVRKCGGNTVEGTIVGGNSLNGTLGCVEHSTATQDFNPLREKGACQDSTWVNWGIIELVSFIIYCFIHNTEPSDGSKRTQKWTSLRKKKCPSDFLQCWTPGMKGNQWSGGELYCNGKAQLYSDPLKSCKSMSGFLCSGYLLFAIDIWGYLDTVC